MRHRDPVVAPDAFIASPAVLVGDVRIGPATVIDHGALIVSTGAPVELGARVAVMPGAVIRSAGGERPPHPVSIGDRPSRARLPHRARTSHYDWHLTGDGNNGPG